MNKPNALPVALLACLAMLVACSEKSPEPSSMAADETAAPPAPDAAPPAMPAPTPPATVNTAPAPAPKPAATAPKPASTAPAPRPVQAASITVPAGTVLNLELTTALSTRTAKVGDPVAARLTDAVMVDGKTAIASGTTIAGSVIEVVSGSDKVGGTPALGISFDIIELAGGKDVPISGTITEKGKSDTARDTVKIVGGTAAGALIGDKVIKGKKGKIIGGVLGGAVGAVAAKKTGTEVKLEEGAPMAVTLDAPVEITK